MNKLTILLAVLALAGCKPEYGPETQTRDFHDSVTFCDGHKGVRYFQIDRTPSYRDGTELRRLRVVCEDGAAVYKTDELPMLFR